MRQSNSCLPERQNKALWTFPYTSGQFTASSLSLQSPSTKTSFLPCTKPELRVPRGPSSYMAHLHGAPRGRTWFSMATNADILTKQHKFQVSKKVATRTLQTTLGDGLPSAKFYCSRAKLILITGGAKRLSHQQSPRYRNRTHFRKSANVCFGISADAIGTCRCL